MANDTTNAISQAWKQHRDGNAKGAVSEFQRITSRELQSIDAFYGLGLAQKSAGQAQDAIASFKKALELVESGAGRDKGQSEVISDHDRYMMLGRMIKQRLSELNATPGK
jgi:tetratricopeptide (TPR) repeat protein